MKSIKYLLLLVLLSVMTVQQTWADYVTDIVVIGHDSGKQIGYLYDNYKGAGWICFEKDLNDGAGGHYIHLVYKTNKSPNNSGTPITDLYLWSAPYAGPDNFVRDGRTYYRIGADGDSEFISHRGDMTNAELAAALGDGWEVKDSKVIPLVKKVNAGGINTNPAFYDVAVTAAEPIRITPGLTAGTEGDGSVTFVGTYDPVEIGPEGDKTLLYFSTNNTLYWPNGAMTIKPFSAYFQLNGATAAQARAYVINFGDGETTGIRPMVNGQWSMVNQKHGTT